ncbi:MAG: glycerol kinase, partial [Thermoprotei archaeon]
MPRVVVSIDQGTTGTRATVVDEEGSVLGYAYREHRQIYPRPGWVEHDPREIWLNTLDVVKRAMEAAGVGPGDVVAIGVTNQRETVVVWDPQSGEPLYNAIVWQCRRTAPLVEKLREEYLDLIYSRTGLFPDPYFSSTKIWWLLDNVPGLRERA